MRNESWVDRALQRIDKENILHLLSENTPPEEIAKELNISRKYVEDIAEEQESRGLLNEELSCEQ